jgi:D-beta-D-heptose 7-phosphate kinase/D-beta-D-heptose 1-phosphate adenosyltransferase
MDLHQLKQGKILIIGDIILDEYLQGTVSRVSPEAPVPVLRPDDRELRLGGAANVASNVKSLGSKVELIGVVGKDTAAKELRELLKNKSIRTSLTNSEKTTVHKLRLSAGQQQLLRLDREESFTKKDWLATKNTFSKKLKGFNAVIVSDYGKGTLVDVPFLIKQSKKRNIPVFIDPKGSNFNKYKGAYIITPNFLEFSTEVGGVSSESDFTNKANKLIKKLALQALLVTKGQEGMTLFKKDRGKINRTDFPTEAKDVFDVTGAGDTVIASLASAQSSGMSLEDSVKLANVAAGIVVGKSGTATPSLVELSLSLNADDSLISNSEIKDLVKAAKKDSKKIVFTNGCFDLLHPGHITYLSEAKKLGDRLIVALNTDRSVKRLKGNKRPINNLRHRALQVAALDSVDWVTSFSQDTPLKLIKELEPDVLVKGKDYKVKDIVGSKEVLSKGGQVKTIKLVKGVSTSNLIKKIKDLDS